MDRCRISLRPAIKFGPFRRENIRTNSQDAACDRPPEPTYLTYFTTYKLFFPLLCPELVPRIAFSRPFTHPFLLCRERVCLDFKAAPLVPRDQFARVPRGNPKGRPSELVPRKLVFFVASPIENARRSFPTYRHIFRANYY